MTVSCSKVEVTRFFDDECPAVIYFIPSGFKGKTIQVIEDPVWGTDCLLINEEEKREMLVRLGQTYVSQEGKEETQD